MDIEDRILKEKKRGDCYKLLAACFYPPRKKLFLEEGVFKSLAMLFRDVCPETDSYLTQMEEAFSACSEEELLIEYARLFVGPYALKAPPYGSVYLDGEKRVFGDSTMEVIRIYEEAGLAMDRDFKELPDHIAVELEFMYYLIYRGIETRVKSKPADVMKEFKSQETFLKRYLGAWIPDFSKAVIENSNNDFYLHLAKCLAVFIKTDMEYLSTSLREIG